MHMVINWKNTNQHAHGDKLKKHKLSHPWWLTETTQTSMHMVINWKNTDQYAQGD